MYVVHGLLQSTRTNKVHGQQLNVKHWLPPTQLTMQRLNFFCCIKGLGMIFSSKVCTARFLYRGAVHVWFTMYVLCPTCLLQADSDKICMDYSIGKLRPGKEL